MAYRRINVSTFAYELQTGLHERVQNFIYDTVKKQKEDPEKVTVRSVREWTIEFQEWARKNNLEKMIKDYISGK